MIATGSPSAVCSDPKGATVQGVAFTPLSADQYALFVAAWGATPKKDVTVEYTMPGAVVVKVTGA